MIEKRVAESGIEISRICSFLELDVNEINKMYSAESIDSNYLLRWSKLLEYDFFRIYMQHLVLYSPEVRNCKIEGSLPKFRKNIYTKEIIDFILELIENNKKSKLQVIQEYNIPKTTLYKWISKYKK